MAKVKVKVNLSIVLLVDTIFNSTTAKQIGKMHVNETKRLLASGQSPVRGRGRFTRYAVQRTEAVSDYPTGIKDKKPVNLELSGDMLKHLDFKRVGKTAVSVGMHKDTPPKLLARATAHNNGDTKKRIPKRQFIPDKQGEEYVITIQRKRKAILEKRLRGIIRISNRKKRKR